MPHAAANAPRVSPTRRHPHGRVQRRLPRKTNRHVAPSGRFIVNSGCGIGRTWNISPSPLGLVVMGSRSIPSRRTSEAVRSVPGIAIRPTTVYGNTDGNKLVGELTKCESIVNNRVTYHTLLDAFDAAGRPAVMLPRAIVEAGGPAIGTWRTSAARSRRARSPPRPRARTRVPAPRTHILARTEVVCS
jgi:hypothetical protein